MKKNVLIGLCVLSGIFAALFAVQVIDEKVNGEDYLKVLTYLNSVSRQLYDNACISEIDKYDGSAQKTERKNIGLACKLQSDKINNIDIPILKNKRKTKLILQYRNAITDALNLYGETFQYETREEVEPKLLDFKANYNKLSIIGYELSLNYSIKDILIRRPTLFLYEIRLLAK